MATGTTHVVRVPVQRGGKHSDVRAGRHDGRRILPGKVRAAGPMVVGETRLILAF